MKSRNEVESLARQLLADEYNRRLEANTQRLPVNCTHNHRHLLDVRKLVRGDRNKRYNRISETDQTIGLCLLHKGVWSGSPLDESGHLIHDPPEEPTWNGDICEDPIDAQRCPMFTQRMSREQVLSDLDRDIRDPEWVETNMPQLSVLFWVLTQPPKLSWYQRLKLLFVGRRYEPLKALPSSDFNLNLP